MCPGDGCERINHKSIHGFLAHVRRSHPVASRLLGPGQTNAIEECAILPEELGEMADYNGESDSTSNVGAEDAAKVSVEEDEEELRIKDEPVEETEDDVEENHEEIRIKDEPVEETEEGLDQGLDSYEDDGELHTKLWIEGSSGSQTRVDPDTLNEHGKRSGSVSSADEPSKRRQPETVFPKRIVRRY